MIDYEELKKEYDKQGLRLSDFYKEERKDKVWWISSIDEHGPLYFSFDKKTIYNYWEDYPQNLTPEQKEIFDKDNPFWRDFGKERK